MSLLHILSYGAAVAAFAFVVLSLASGLLWLSEVIEENTKTSKLVGQRGIYVILGLHALLCYTDSLPFWKIFFSATCHVIYLQNFSDTWPVISLTSPSFMASCILVIADHFLWFFHFAKITHDARQRSHRIYGRPVHDESVPGFTDIATFFILCIWLAPLFLFLSLSINDNALPTMSFTGAQTSVDTRPKPSLFKSIFSTSTRRDKMQEGIIAPRSPNLKPTHPGTPGLSVPSLHDIPSRPTSPGLGLGPAPGLSRPPLSPRVSAEYARPGPGPRGPQRAYTMDGSRTSAEFDRVGLGMRRVPSQAYPS